MKLNIPIILGTAREGNNTQLAARYILEQAKAYGFKTQLLDVKDYVTVPHTVRDKAIGWCPWSMIMNEADGLIIVSPEYNHGYPGELKLMLDQIYAEYAKKPLGIVSAGGVLGGGRMTEQLREVAIEFRMVNIEKAIYFPMVWTAFDEKGQPKDATYETRVKEFFDELAWFGETLKKARK